MAPKKETKKKNPLMAGEEEAQKEGKTPREDIEESKDPADKEINVSRPIEKKVVRTDTSLQDLRSDIAKTKAAIEVDEKVMFMIPLADGEKAGMVHECWVNGYKYTVKKGIMQKIPITIANMLAETYRISSEAGNANRLDLHPEKSAENAE